jgi:hypothetical protein
MSPFPSSSSSSSSFFSFQAILGSSRSCFFLACWAKRFLKRLKGPSVDLTFLFYLTRGSSEHHPYLTFGLVKG